jgi:branched-chain amino acid transport system substrate-binding protein
LAEELGVKYRIGNRADAKDMILASGVLGGSYTAYELAANYAIEDTNYLSGATLLARAYAAVPEKISRDQAVKSGIDRSFRVVAAQAGLASGTAIAEFRRPSRSLFPSNSEWTELALDLPIAFNFRGNVLSLNEPTSGGGAIALAKYDAGATDTEIKIGNIMPYSGPAAAYGIIGKTEAAYFRKVNAEGGINGRKINFISYDDGYSPPKAVEQARKLIESDEVLLLFSPLGTATNTAIQKYMNAKKVPQLFVASGATKFGDPKNFPWTMGWQLNYQSEGNIYGRFILKNYPNAKIAVLYQNDDYGRDYLKGLKDGLGSTASTMIIAEESYEVTEPSIDNHLFKLKATGADVFFDMTAPQFTAQAIKKAAEIDWRALHILNHVSASVRSVMKSAGFNDSQRIISAQYLKDTTDAQWASDPGMKQFLDFMTRYFPEGDKFDNGAVVGYGLAQTLAQVLKQCGDNLTRENVMKQAANLKNFRTEILLPDITISTSPTDFVPISQLQLMRFKGEKWELFGPVISADDVGG